MKFTTPVTVDTLQPPIGYADRMIAFGSCFAETMGERLSDACFRCDINPFGTLYNPFSIAEALTRLLENRPFTEAELFEHGGCWHSFSHHSRFSNPDKSEALRGMNARYEAARAALPSTSWLLITWGTAYIYRLPDGAVVANCHKLPERTFERSLASVEAIVERWRTLLAQLRAVNPSLKVMFTVSPIRHFRDGAHANQLSKATLLLAQQRLMAETENCFYFPAYEIALDELRDYRFFATDMVHLSELAVEYIWERFKEHCLDKTAQTAMAEWEDLSRRLRHRPLQPHSAEAREFQKQNLLKLRLFAEKFPYFDIPKELNISE